MSNDDPNLSDKQTEESVAEWKQTLKRLGLTETDIMQVRPEDILYFLDRWQFLQIVESTGQREPYAEPTFIEANSGWTIIDYGNAMCTSPGKLIFGLGGSSEDDEEGGGGHGTIFKQAFDSAAEMIRLAQEHGWKGVTIVDGHPDMQRAAWVEAVKRGVRLEGYSADVAAELKRRRIDWSTADVEMAKQKMAAIVAKLESN